MNLLHKVLREELALREKVLSTQVDLEQAFLSVRDAVHQEMAPILDELLALNIKGDYGRPVLVASCNPRERVLHRRGVSLHLAKTISPMFLQLDIDIGGQLPNGVLTPPKAVLKIHQDYPYKPQELKSFDTTQDSAAVMVEAYLKALAPYVVMEEAVAAASA